MQDNLCHPYNYTKYYRTYYFRAGQKRYRRLRNMMLSLRRECTADTNCASESKPSQYRTRYVDEASELFTEKRKNPTPPHVPSELQRRVLEASRNPKRTRGNSANHALPFFDTFYNYLRDFKGIFQL